MERIDIDKKHSKKKTCQFDSDDSESDESESDDSKESSKKLSD